MLLKIFDFTIVRWEASIAQALAREATARNGREPTPPLEGDDVPKVAISGL